MDPSWVDQAQLGDVTMLQSFSGGRGNTLQELFWNRSITRVALLPGAAKFDSFRTERVRVADDGSLTVNGRPLAGPLLADIYGSTVRLQDARVVGRSQTATLWLPDRSAGARLRLYAIGRYSDGWLAKSGAIYVWPSVPGQRVSGWVSMRLTASRLVGAATITFQFSEHARTDRAREARAAAECAPPPLRSQGRPRHLSLEEAHTHRSPRRDRQGDGSGVHAQRSGVRAALADRSTRPTLVQMSPLRSAIWSPSVYAPGRFEGSTSTGIVTSTVGYWSTTHVGLAQMFALVR